MVLLRLFKNNRTGGIVLLVLLAILTSLISLIHPQPPLEWQGMPLYDLIFGELYRFPRLSVSISILFHLLIALVLIRLNTRFSLIEERTYMPALFYLIISTVFPSTHTVNPLQIGGLFYLLSFIQILNAHEDRPDTYRVFNAFLLFFLGTLFYAKLIWFLPVLWLVLFTVRPATFRELMYSIVAACFTGVSLFVYYWVFRDAGWMFPELLRNQLQFTGSWEVMPVSNYVFIAYIFLLVIIASISILKRYQVKKIIIRNIYRVLLYMFLFSFVFYFLLSRYEQATIIFTAIPLSFLLANYFHQKRYRVIREILIWALLGLAVLVQMATL